MVSCAALEDLQDFHPWQRDFLACLAKGLAFQKTGPLMPGTWGGREAWRAIQTASQESGGHPHTRPSGPVATAASQ
jgi:hypothetical protein